MQKQNKFQEFWKQVQDEINAMINPQTGLIDANYTLSRACPVCNSTQADFIFNKYGFTHVRCRHCSLVYVEPVLSEENLIKMYQSTHSLDLYATLLTNESKKRRDLNSLAIVKKVKEKKKTPGMKWLDIGCGYGSLLKEAKKEGFEVFGIEPSKDCQKHLRKEVGAVVFDTLDSATLSEGYFDVISLKQVIEHLFDPRAIVQHCYRLLKPGGVLWIATPNTKGAGMKLMKAAHPSYQRGHINMFNQLSMRKLLRDAQFHDLHLSTYGLKTLHLLSFLKGAKDVRKEVFKAVDALPTEGGWKRKMYYRGVLPSVNFFTKVTRTGDYLEVFAFK